MYLSNIAMFWLFLVGNLSLAAMIYGVENGRVALIILSGIMVFWCVGLFIIGLASHVPLATAIPGDEFDDQDDDDDDDDYEYWRHSIKGV